MDQEPFFLMGTGSRSMLTNPHRVDIYNSLKDWVLAFREQHPGLVLISGMAEGWDEAVAKIGMREGIPYIAAVPNQGYGDYYWRRKTQTGENRIHTFNTLLAHAKEVVYVCDTLYVDGVHSNFVRNSWMVDRTNEAVAYMAHSSGTRDAIAKLAAKKIPYTLLDASLMWQRTMF